MGGGVQSFFATLVSVTVVFATAVFALAVPRELGVLYSHVF